MYYNGIMVISKSRASVINCKDATCRILSEMVTLYTCALGCTTSAVYQQIYCLTMYTKSKFYNDLQDTLTLYIYQIVINVLGDFYVGSLDVTDKNW